MKTLITLAMALSLQAQSPVTIHRHDAQKLSVLTGLPGGGDFIQVSAMPTRQNISAIKLIVRIQDGDELIVFERSVDTNGKALNYFIPVVSASRAVVKASLTQRVDLNTSEYLE